MLCRFSTLLFAMGPTKRLSNATLPTQRTNCLGRKVERERQSDKAHMATITATKIATEARIDPKVFRELLCNENFEWPRFNDCWTVEAGSEEHRAMERVLNKITR
jgi:hypothetical protein